MCAHARAHTCARCAPVRPNKEYNSQNEHRHRETSANERTGRREHARKNEGRTPNSTHPSAAKTAISTSGEDRDKNRNKKRGLKKPNLKLASVASTSASPCSSRSSGTMKDHSFTTEDSSNKNSTVSNEKDISYILAWTPRVVAGMGNVTSFFS